MSPYIPGAEPEGVELTLWIDGVEQVGMEQYTDSLGQAKFYILEEGDYVVKYKDANGNNNNVDILETISDTYIEAVMCYLNIFTMMWSHDLSLLNMEDVDLQYYDGSTWVTVDTKTTSAVGEVSFGSMTFADWRFMFGELISTEIITIVPGDVFADIEDDVYFEAIKEIVSICKVILGEICFMVISTNWGISEKGLLLNFFVAFIIIYPFITPNNKNEMIK